MGFVQETAGRRAVKSVMDMIEIIRECPFILGRPTVQNLYMFLSGFAYASKETADDHHVLSEFGSFVRLRFDVSSSQSWGRIIEFYSVSETEEMKLFWKLWDEFRAQQEQVKRNGAVTRRSRSANKRPA